MAVTSGYQALRESAAWLDLDNRGRIRLTGEDCARLLHAMCTNHIQQMKPGDSCYTFFLNAQGRILSDAYVLCFEDSFLLDTEPDSHDILYAHLDKFIIADDVTLADERQSWSTIGVEGPTAAQLPGAFPISYTGAPGSRVFIPRADKDALVATLGIMATPEDAEAVRLEHFRPRYGADITDKNLVHETQLMHSIHFTKGCYLGQEIVERVRSRGQVHRLLVPLYIDSTQPPTPGTPVTAAGAAAGDTMSSAFSPALNRSIAFAYLRAEHVKPGNALTVGDSPAEVAALKGS